MPADHFDTQNKLIFLAGVVSEMDLEGLLDSIATDEELRPFLPSAPLMPPVEIEWLRTLARAARDFQREAQNFSAHITTMRKDAHAHSQH